LRLANWLLIGAVLLIAGCDSKSGESAPVPAREIAGSATVKGKILFVGTVPEMGDIPNVPCHEGAPALKEETVVVGADGGLKNVLVSIEGIGPGAPRKGEVPLLDQVNCRYVPHVIGVTVGQEMTIRTSDKGTMHNVHMKPDLNPAMNFGQTAAGQEKKVTFAKPEYIQVKCDVHPWMGATIGVFENPFFAVSGDDGSYEIKGVPAGSYKLVTWHEQFGRREMPVVVSDGAVVDGNVTYGK